MSNSVMTAHSDRHVAQSVFGSVLVGVDGSEPGFRAVRQARRLVAPGGRLTLFTAVHLIEAHLADWSAPEIEAQLEKEAGDVAARAVEIAGPHAVTRLANGPPLPSLLDELKEADATLAVVGTHEHSRLSEILVGGVVGELLHRAPCSVCVARPSGTEAPFPGAIVAGCDGSPSSDTAVAAARFLADRYNVPLTVVTAVGGAHVDLERTRALGTVEVEGHPVDGLVEASLDADLLVVGSRSLRGIRSLGSVSERVAHQAQCSVLVVRPQA